jgi:hypothetical protein
MIRILPALAVCLWGALSASAQPVLHPGPQTALEAETPAGRAPVTLSPVTPAARITAAVLLDTLQPEAAKMDPRYLKDHFGSRLMLHGCISTAGPVAYGTPEDVRRDVQEKLDILLPGGGYCFSPTHQLQDNSPVENVIEMYQSAHDLGHG